jgi:hypothetical protein
VNNGSPGASLLDDDNVVAFESWHVKDGSKPRVRATSGGGARVDAGVRLSMHFSSAEEGIEWFRAGLDEMCRLADPQ